MLCPSLSLSEKEMNNESVFHAASNDSFFWWILYYPCGGKKKPPHPKTIPITVKTWGINGSSLPFIYHIFDFYFLCNFFLERQNLSFDHFLPDAKNTQWLEKKRKC